MNIELTIKGTLVKGLKTKPFSLAVKKKLFEIDSEYSDLLDKVKPFSIDDLADFNLDEGVISKLKGELSNTRNSNLSLSMFLLEQTSKNPKLKELLNRELSDDDEIEYSIYKLKVLKAILDFNSIRTEEHKKGFEEDPKESDFYQNLDLREVEEIIKQFRTPQPKGAK